MTPIPLVDLKAQYAAIQPDIDAAIARVIASTAFVGGPAVADFEAAWAAFQQAPHAVGCGSGTAALVLALKALEIGPGDEVITSAHTFVATVEAIELDGATPVLVDIDPLSYCLDAAQVEAAITPATRAIVPVHLYGQIGPMDQIAALARRHGLAIVEDAAQAHAAEYGGHRAGHWGAAACFSFYPGKNLGAYGEAGAVVTRDPALARRVALLRDHGSAAKNVHDVIGYNERLDAIQAAVLSAKLPYLEAWTEARRRHAAAYTARLRDVPGVTVPVELPGARHVYHIYCIRVPGDRDAIQAALNARGIGAGVHYPIPLHLQPALAHRGWQRGQFPEAEAAAATILSLPLYPELTEAQIETVVAALREALGVTP